MARPTDVFLASSAFVASDGYSMVLLDCGAVESQFVRAAMSSEFMCPTSLAVFDLDCPQVRKDFRQKRVHKRHQGFSLITHWTSHHPSSSPCQRTHSEPSMPRPLPQPCTCEWPPSPQTQAVLTRLGLRTIENSTSTHCWWLASSLQTKTSLLDLMVSVMDFAISELGWTAAAATSLLSPATSGEQIEVAVAALSLHYPRGLLVFHDPAAGAFLFLPRAGRIFVSYQTACRWAAMFPSTDCMLYTQAPGSDLGHFQACIRSTLGQRGLYVPPSHTVPCCPSFLLGNGLDLEQEPGKATRPGGAAPLPPLCSDPACFICSDALPPLPTQLEDSGSEDKARAPLVFDLEEEEQKEQEYEEPCQQPEPMPDVQRPADPAPRVDPSASKRPLPKRVCSDPACPLCCNDDVPPNAPDTTAKLEDSDRTISPTLGFEVAELSLGKAVKL